MRVTYLGTAAAEGIPGLFCECAVCRKARERKGRHIRTRSQCLINDDLLIDLGPDTYAHTLARGTGLSGIRDVLITHPHADHFSPLELIYRDSAFARELPHPSMTVHGSKDAIGLAEAAIRSEHPRVLEGPLGLNVLEPFASAAVGEGYTVTPLPATHGTEMPFVYLIEYKDLRVLYLHDTGILTDTVIGFLAERGGKIDLVSYDCTHGARDTADTDGHMGILSAARLRDRLAAKGLFYDDTLHVLSHFSHNGETASYDECRPIAAKYAFILSYDGYELVL